MHRAGRWALSPAYDINPVPEIDRTRTPKTPIAESGEEPSIEAALAAAVRFGLKSADAKAIVREVLSAVSRWREVGKQIRVKASTLDAYSTAFDNPMMADARKLNGATT